MNNLLSHAIWYLMLFQAFIGSVTLFLFALAVRDWWKCKRYRMEQERENE